MTTSALREPGLRARAPRRPPRTDRTGAETSRSRQRPWAAPHGPRFRRTAAEAPPRRLREMKLLLETRAFLWWIGDDARLSDQARDAIADPDNEVSFSVASAWGSPSWRRSPATPSLRSRGRFTTTTSPRRHGSARPLERDESPAPGPRAFRASPERVRTAFTCPQENHPNSPPPGPRRVRASFESLEGPS